MITGLTVSPTIDCHKTKTKTSHCVFTQEIWMKCACVCSLEHFPQTQCSSIRSIGSSQSTELLHQIHHWINMQLEFHFTHRNTLIFAFHGPQTRLPVPLFFAAQSKRVRFTGSQKKRKKRKKIGQENRKQNIFFCFLIFTEHLNKTGEPNTKGKLAVSVNDTLFVEHTRATPPNTKQRYKVVIKVKTFLSDTAEALEAWRGYTSQSTRLFVFLCV